jgi:hypothetical protein
MNTLLRKFASSLFLAALFAASSAAAQTYEVETVNVPAPQELAVPVRDALSSNAVRVSGPQGILCEIWLRKAVPASATPSGELGVAYGQLSDGTLVGAIRFAAAAKDYRQQETKPGVYTLRYALQPVDGNHQGVSPYRDYLLLAPAAADTSVASLNDKDMYALSRKASGTGHPSVWSLVAADGAPSALPGIVHQDDGDLWVVYFQAPLQPAGSALSPVKIGLVIVGHAPEA